MLQKQLNEREICHIKTYMIMERKTIILVYQTDAWHSTDSRMLVYIGENMEDIIAQLTAHRGMTADDAQEIRRQWQTQCNNRGWEWEFEQQYLNTFTD